MKKRAFTLAEVLITLGIIGIVAAMTLPILVNKYQKKVTAERVKKAYSEMSNAIKLSEAFNGEIKDWNFITTGNRKENTKIFLEKYILPYFKNIKTCKEGNSEECGVPVSSDGQNYVFGNGVQISFVTSVVPARAMVSVLIDTNGPQKPNIIGKDVFYFEIRNNKFVPFEWESTYTREQLIEGISNYAGTMACRPSRDSDSDNDKSLHYNLYMCTALLMVDGWEFKDDYPW